MEMIPLTEIRNGANSILITTTTTIETKTKEERFHNGDQLPNLPEHPPLPPTPQKEEIQKVLERKKGENPVVGQVESWFLRQHHYHQHPDHPNHPCRRLVVDLVEVEDEAAAAKIMIMILVMMMNEGGGAPGAEARAVTPAVEVAAAVEDQAIKKRQSHLPENIEVRKQVIENDIKIRQHQIHQRQDLIRQLLGIAVTILLASVHRRQQRRRVVWTMDLGWILLPFPAATIMTDLGILSILVIPTILETPTQARVVNKNDRLDHLGDRSPLVKHRLTSKPREARTISKRFDVPLREDLVLEVVPFIRTHQQVGGTKLLDFDILGRRILVHHFHE